MSDRQSSTVVAVPTLHHSRDTADLLRCLAEAVPAGTDVVLLRSGVTAGESLPPEMHPLPPGVRALCVSQLGLAVARQAALESGSDVVVFIDDDCIPSEGWFDAMCAAMQDPSVAAAGGTIQPGWPSGRPPKWLPARMAVLYGERQAGGACRHHPFGGNMAVRAADALAAGGFSIGLGVVGSTPSLHEDTELCERLVRAGARVVEAPDAVVVHRIRPEQLRRRWLLRRTWHEGRSDAKRDRLRGEHAISRHALKLAGLTLALPVALPVGLLDVRAGVYVVARAIANCGYVVEMAVPARRRGRRYRHRR